jgi:hypothetical protein
LFQNVTSWLFDVICSLFFLVSPFLLVFCQHSTTIRQFTSLLHPLLTLSAKLLALAKFSMVELRA